MEHEEIKKLLEEYFFKVSVTTNGDLFLQVYNEDDTIPAMQSMAIIAEKLKELGKQEGIPKRCTKCNNRFLQNDHIHITRNGAFHTNCYKVNNLGVQEGILMAMEATRKAFTEKAMVNISGEFKYWNRNEDNESYADDKYFPEEIYQSVVSALTSLIKKEEV